METMILTLLVIMFVESYTIGSIPFVMPMSEEKLNLLSALGGGLLVGTALTVSIPEGIRSLESVSYSHIQTTATTVAAHAEPAKTSDANSLVGISLLLGFVLMLVIDHYLQSGVSSESHIAATIGLVVHAAADGVVLGAATKIDEVSVEIIVFISIMLHKAPEAFGLVTFLLHEGLERKHIRRHLIIFALSAPVTTLLTYVGLGEGKDERFSSASAIGIAILFGAGTFLYVATVHILPELISGSGRTHKGALIRAHVGKKGLRTTELVCLIVGSLVPLFLTLGYHH